MRPLWLSLLLAGCVVKYGAPAASSGGGASSAPSTLPAGGADFTALEARIDALLVSTEDRDQRDRLSAAADLARQSARLPVEAQAVNHAFLQRLLSVEERGLPYAAPTMGPVGRAGVQLSPVVEEDPEAGPGASEAAADPPAVVAPPPDAPALLASARQLLTDGDFNGAMASLEPCRGQACWSEVSGTWAEARDALVFKAREEAGTRYLAARQEVDPEARAAALREVRDVLTELLQRYPDSTYADALQRNLALVQGDLDALSAP